VKEISYILGYNEMSAFTRAFKRWTGTTPANYQRA
ncbi:MAG: helix-turn-helix domain-containing protein, partial [Bacteroidota bacterium]